jgi:2-polyprenyl-3-methyl-5-hydroxy-6-metoxy-1,4-benzoquinol methylase
MIGEKAMQIIQNNKLDLALLESALKKPWLYEKSTDVFWDDPHISEKMLELHLDPNVNSASKTKATIAAEAGFIIGETGMGAGKAVLDMGCGPGLYAAEFAKTGARVTGMDISARSIEYAKTHAGTQYAHTSFLQMDYLRMAYQAAFDIAVMIFYDFCVLCETEQNALLGRIHAALKPGGFFVFDVVSENRKTAEGTNVSVCGGGFWSDKPYMEICQTYLYAQPRTEGQQYVVIDEDGGVRITRFYNRLFSVEALTRLLEDNGFRAVGIYENLKGDALSQDSETYGVIAARV